MALEIVRGGGPSEVTVRVSLALTVRNQGGLEMRKGGLFMGPSTGYKGTVAVIEARQVTEIKNNFGRVVARF